MYPSFPAKPPQNIVVVRLSAIGDACHALAVVRNLADNWPDTKLTWIIGKTEAALLSDIEGIEFIIFDKRKGLSAILDVKRQLAGRRFDVALCMHASARVNLLYPFIDAALKLGFDKPRARDFQWLFTNRQVDRTAGKHALDAMLSFAGAIGAEPTAPRWEIPLSEKHRAFATSYRQTTRCGANKPLVVVSPCSSQRSRNYRNWTIGNFIQTSKHIGQAHNGTVVLTGSNAELDRSTCRAIAHACDNAIDLSGKTTLKELLALLAEADAVISPDSGPVHMATAVGTPVVGLYASSNPERTGPYLQREYTVNRYPEAALEFLGKTVVEMAWGERVREPDAMTLIEIDEVCAKTDQILADFA